MPRGTRIRVITVGRRLLPPGDTAWSRDVATHYPWYAHEPIARVHPALDAQPSRGLPATDVGAMGALRQAPGPPFGRYDGGLATWCAVAVKAGTPVSIVSRTRRLGTVLAATFFSSRGLYR